MHKLMEYICNELDEIERKADKEGNLSASEVEYADKLLHMKKNLLKSEEMMEESEMSYMDGPAYINGEDGQSRRGGSSYRSGGNSYRRGGSSYARGRGRNARRDSMGRYSREGGYSRAEDFRMELEELIEDAPNDRVRQKMHELMQEM